MADMDNSPPAYVPLVFAVFMAIAAFIHIRYARQLKVWRDRWPRFRMYPASAYRACGWMFAAGSVLLASLAALLFFTR